MVRIVSVTTVLAAVLVVVPAGTAVAVVNCSLDGGGNNVVQPQFGQTNQQYLRVGAANYADGIVRPVAGPPSRRVSNRIFNDVGQNLFSERNISQFGWTWGQFMDHDFALRRDTPVGERTPIAFSGGDPLEEFTNDFGGIDFLVHVAGSTAHNPVVSGSCLPVHGIRKHAGGT